MLRCKGCGEGVSAVVIRLKNHASNCKALKAKGFWSILGPVKSSHSTLRVTRTNSQELSQVHRALARLIIAENLPFTLLDSPFLSSFIAACRPGSKPLTKYSLLTEQLPREYAELQGELRGRLHGKQVTLSIDGWTAPGQHHTLGVAI